MTDYFVFISVDLMMWLHWVHGNIKFVRFGSTTARRSSKRLTSGSVKILLVVEVSAIRVSFI